MQRKEGEEQGGIIAKMMDGNIIYYDDWKEWITQNKDNGHTTKLSMQNFKRFVESKTGTKIEDQIISEHDNIIYIIVDKDRGKFLSGCSREDAVIFPFVGFNFIKPVLQHLMPELKEDNNDVKYWINRYDRKNENKTLIESAIDKIQTKYSLQGPIEAIDSASYVKDEEVVHAIATILSKAISCMHTYIRMPPNEGANDDALKKKYQNIIFLFLKYIDKLKSKHPKLKQMVEDVFNRYPDNHFYTNIDEFF